jgi:hypothetical protein
VTPSEYAALVNALKNRGKAKKVNPTPSHRMPPFDERIMDVDEPSTELERIIYAIRISSDRVAGEDWQAFGERTRDLGIAELRRRKRRLFRVLYYLE